MKFNDKLYDVLKWVAMIVLPACATLISVILSQWDICEPNTISAIVTTITACSTFIGALIGISTAQYNKSEDK